MPATPGLVGVILAGGSGSRLYPCTKVTNKHLLPIGDMPMIFYPLKKLVGAGITDILIVTGTEHMGDFISLLGSGKDFGCRLTYRVQDDAGGIAQALALAERFANGQPMCVILGDNIFEDSIKDTIGIFMKDPSAAHIILKEVPDAERFGVAIINGNRITKIIEKPDEPPTQLAVTGIYCYPGDVFDIIKGLKPSARNELEITDVNNEYIGAGRLGYSMFDGYWSDAGTFSSLAKANELVRSATPNF
ncbi:MAG: sugar phosphate nucleotidyltransferase [Bacteroidota bacterium]|nr:sugar phosphate nucleotidyltransferase [Bacteroidota bacterium]MDP4229582.1 sugar phosphate nucleotidyltransferase [Bacteroidota bacterium]MDP4236977.1 sugar phosphate nucleotidyltransferase [Bacteroidota bacterium]